MNEPVLTDRVGSWGAQLEGLAHESGVTAALRTSGARLRELANEPRFVLGVAAERERAETIVPDLARRLDSNVLVRSVTLDRTAKNVPLADAWVLVLAADQLGSLVERELVAEVARPSRSNIALCVRTERVPADRVSDVLAYSAKLFAPEGVSPDEIFPVQVPTTGAGDEPEDLDLTGLAAHVTAWLDRREELRDRAVGSEVERAVKALRKESEVLRARLRDIPRLREAEQRRDDFAMAARTIEQSLRASAEEMPRRMREALHADWAGWVAQMRGLAANQRLSREVVRARLTAFVEGRLFPRLGDELRAEIETLMLAVPSLAEELRDLPVATEAEVRGTSVERVEAARPAPRGVAVAVTVAATSAAALAAWLLGARKLALLAAVSGGSLAFLLRGGRSAEAEGSVPDPWNATQRELESQLDALCVRVVQEAVEAFVDRCDMRRRAFEDAVAAASAVADTRLKLEESLHDLERLVAAAPIGRPTAN